MGRCIILFIFVMCINNCFWCQKSNKITHRNDYSSLYLLPANKNNGFEISASAIALFSLGAKDRNGFRWGLGITFSKYFGDFKISTGTDTYKAKQNFGLGTSFAGIVYHDGKYGGSYYLNHYYQGDKQTSAILGVYLDDFEIRFEDDILALPFTHFKVYDRYRTAALEVRYKHILIDTNVYTNEVNGLTDVSKNNRRGVYTSSKQISSPVYVGYTNKNLIIRYGINSKLGGYLGQNWWHEKLFDSTNFNYGTFRNQFLQIGVDKPYTLY